MAFIAKAIMEPTSETVAARGNSLMLSYKKMQLWTGHRQRERTMCPFTQGMGGQ
jgi:hypothetical protein